MSVSKMKKLTAFVFRDDADRLVRSLMRLRCVQVRFTKWINRRLRKAVTRRAHGRP